jgi:hypothetical protein
MPSDVVVTFAACLLVSIAAALLRCAVLEDLYLYPRRSLRARKKLRVNAAIVFSWFRSAPHGN